ncbi:MAG TPA: assimilatory sulfite reductase (NADPH) flavoprotein subunit, partial [Mizugakiibacter sp.]|nr:assimilatory sulfite reductase (NADPH) flavoprotein subunit [Mizugakiibacter sp.]
PRLPNLHFAVLGLGDSSYPKFCAVGRRLDGCLEKQGATRLIDLGEADVAIEEVAKPWTEQVLGKVVEALPCVAPTLRLMPPRTPEPTPSWSRKQPFIASVLTNQRIVARDSEREIRHLELSLQGSGLHYHPGDALGVCPANPAALVEQWLGTLQLEGTQPVTFAKRTLSLREWLSYERDITKPYRSWIEAHAERGHHETLNQLLQADQQGAFADLLERDQPIDLLRRYPVEWSAEQLIATLRPLQPRMYSIASSQQEVGDEVHLTVAVVSYTRDGIPHWGAASSFLAAAREGAQVSVFIEPNERFRLPSDSARDVIMIGPGTGVAPFRGFLQERQHRGGSGRNWLVFGNHHFNRDFLYQSEWQAAIKSGVLQRIDLAFSRDTSARVHVQQRLLEQGRDLFTWLCAGAHLYVCGDAKHMAADVHRVLIEIVANQGGQQPDEAQAWLTDLMRQGRYVRDVY